MPRVPASGRVVAAGRVARAGMLPLTPLGQVRQLAQSRPVFTADFFAVDGITGKVASFIDWNDVSQLLAQAVSGSQVAIPAAHVDFSNKLCAAFTSTAQWYQSNKPAASFAYGSDGSGLCSWALIGATTYTGFAPIGLSTCDLSTPANGAGVSMFHQNSTGFRSLISDGSAYCVNHTTGVGGVPVGASRILVDIQARQNPISSLYRNGSLLSTSALTGVFSSGAPKTSPILGFTTGTNGWIQRQRAWGWLPSIGAAQVPQVDALVAQL